jgi:hypothetical protein
MQTLSRDLRRELERTVKQARRVAEAGARKAIERLGVGEAKPPAGLSPAGQSLRERLRAHGRQLGDRREARTGKQVTTRLVAECAYENWHRMLFARFLAENELLIEPEHGVPISLDDCKELARSQAEDWLDLASSYAVKMLPQIFRPNDPVLDVSLPPETRSELEDLLKSLPPAIFQADDSLGWVYQFWQADRKEEVNASESKIGADELPAVTQLFTEDYMVLFLLHNTLGAWWAGKVLMERPELATSAASEDELRAACATGDVEWSYLRFVREGDGPWRPAAGTFTSWPKSAREITVLDPCMGSGHFLVIALPILVSFRMAEEGLSRELAVDSVLRDNLFGLEIDSRCTQIAAFNLALAAWRMVGHRTLPQLQLACSGLALGVTREEWLKLAARISPLPPDKSLFETNHNLFSQQVQGGLEAIYDLFEKAPWLGSLINPRGAGSTLLEAGYKQLEPLLTPLLETQAPAEISEMAVTAQGLSKAAELLARQFTLIATNVPYLGRIRQDGVLREYCARIHPASKAELGACFVDRCIKFCVSNGTIAVIAPHNLFFLARFKAFRERLLNNLTWNLVVRLGEHAFESAAAAGGFAAMAVLSTSAAPNGSIMTGFDVSAPRGQRPIYADRKAALLCLGAPAPLAGSARLVLQSEQLLNPDFAISLEATAKHDLLSKYADSLQGASTVEIEQFRRCFWEVSLDDEWNLHQSTPIGNRLYSGLEYVSAHRRAGGAFHEAAEALKAEGRLGGAYSGQPVWGKTGIAVSWMGTLPAALYLGAVYDNSIAAIVPHDPEHLLPIWCFCSSPEYLTEVRKINQKTQVANATLVKVPFDLKHWQQVAKTEYPNGIPAPYSDDSSQWIFSGHPRDAAQPLHVAVARLLGYRWPRQMSASIPGCSTVDEDGLQRHADGDGIVCLNSSKGEASAADRINALLADAFGAEWSAGKLHTLLRAVGFEDGGLTAWLRDGFFLDHCSIFMQRPFIWHIWDGRQDGFHALVNYHRLAGPQGEGRRTLEKLIYSYMGDWIDRQRREQRAAVDGADARLAAAEHLKTELENILAGEPPYDIFVRWKPLHKQPIGWEPDINDGVRFNIRPFMVAKPLGARAGGACILRSTPKNINYGKDRGKEPHRPREAFPWFWDWDGHTVNFAGGPKFNPTRWTGLHYTTVFKQAARDRHRGNREAMS